MSATIALSLLLAAAPSSATPKLDHSLEACPATPASLPAGLEGWARRTPVRAGVRAAQASELTVGEGVEATLLPTPSVVYAVSPEKPGGPASSGGRPKMLTKKMVR